MNEIQHSPAILIINNLLNNEFYISYPWNVFTSSPRSREKFLNPSNSNEWYYKLTFQKMNIEMSDLVIKWQCYFRGDFLKYSNKMLSLNSQLSQFSIFTTVNWKLCLIDRTYKTILVFSYVTIFGLIISYLITILF